MDENTSRFSTWGRNMYSNSYEYLDPFEGLKQIDKSRGAIPVGNFRSYGDSPLNSNGAIYSSKNFRQMSLQHSEGIFTFGSGVTIGELSKFGLERKFYPFVVPGTSFVTVGGAIAADIHGKSHHVSGSFSRHVTRIKILLGDGKQVDLYPDGPTKKWFDATCGGLGLTGFILEADIRMRIIENEFVDVCEYRFKNLNEFRDLISRFDEEYEYSVAWLDLSGEYSGRGLLSFANHSKISETKKSEWDRGPNKQRFSIPEWFPRIISRLTVNIFNRFWFRKPLSKGEIHLSKYMHPLDGVNNWNRLYGKKGFIQYQFVVPESEFQVLEKILVLLKDSRIASPMAVLKKLGKPSSSLLGFAIEGWTLAIDIPVGSQRVAQLVLELDALVLEHKGKVYLVKDSRLSSAAFRDMYPEVADWKKVKSQMDPDGLWVSDQARRLGLC